VTPVTAGFLQPIQNTCHQIGAAWVPIRTTHVEMIRNGRQERTAWSTPRPTRSSDLI